MGGKSLLAKDESVQVQRQKPALGSVTTTVNRRKSEQVHRPDKSLQGLWLLPKWEWAPFGGFEQRCHIIQFIFKTVSPSCSVMSGPEGMQGRKQEFGEGIPQCCSFVSCFLFTGLWDFWMKDRNKIFTFMKKILSVQKTQTLQSESSSFWISDLLLTVV